MVENICLGNNKIIWIFFPPRTWSRTWTAQSKCVAKFLEKKNPDLYLHIDWLSQTYWNNKYGTAKFVLYGVSCILFLKNDVFLSLKFVLIIVNSSDPDEMPKYMFKGFPIYKGLKQIDKTNVRYNH